jgi:tetratricopeptide (TPR) repeat protein
MTWKDALLQGSQNNPWIDNLLAYLHLQNKQQKKAEALIVSSYQKYPGYVFAKINYADQCLRQRKFKQIPLIFPSFELKTLYPHKKRFHVSEFRGLMIIASRYHALIGDRSHALLYYQKAYQADPSHPSLVLLEKELFSWRFSWKRCLLLFRRSLTLLGVTKR